jgi:hypothetical protein
MCFCEKVYRQQTDRREKWEKMMVNGWGNVEISLVKGESFKKKIFRVESRKI